MSVLKGSHDPRQSAYGGGIPDEGTSIWPERVRQTGQQSFSVQTPDETHWFSRRAGDAA